jgi:sulfoxide reductase heme-binding subunit YedZ
LIRADGLAGKPYILVGLATLALLVPLAATSSKGWVRRLGKRWKSLHRLVYVAALLAAVHYLWLVKAVTIGPVLYAVVIVALLALRLPRVRRLGLRRVSGRRFEQARGA